MAHSLGSIAVSYQCILLLDQDAEEKPCYKCKHSLFIEKTITKHLSR